MNNVKPPIGVLPKYLHEEKIRNNRINSLVDAIKRYRDANLNIPEEWVEELTQLNRIQKESVKLISVGTVTKPTTKINIGTNKGNITNLEVNGLFEDIKYSDVKKIADSKYPGCVIIGWADSEKSKYGVYTYKLSNYDGTFTKFAVEVKIIGETIRSYHVQLLGSTYNRVPGQTLWVQRRKVILNGVHPAKYDPKDTVEPEFWWNKFLD